MNKIISVRYEVEIYDFDYRGGTTNPRIKEFDRLSEAIKCAGSNFNIFVVKVCSERIQLPK